ncbi:glycosyltransferase family 90 protein [Tulasnella calospora MUT 4182]|uniref:Glycosyltransferase family 90 protein n=1 Tax=Tulasnella calospora MUT 4182 TaxID=1051891 RepID=A0A0C3QCY1_9AGAM|nr:glycosyltransferase family 90 protein [Tulasnella calospora MUT 4182]
MALAPTSRRSWRRLTRILIFISFALVCLYYFLQSEDDQLTTWADGELETLTPTRPTIRKPKTPIIRHNWTELWEAKSDGKLVVPIDEKGNAISRIGFAQHPLLDLIEDAENKWKATLQRQSKTLEEAVREYERRYSRPPPKGFDDWYRFATERGVILIDEFDRINADIAPFLALAPKQVRERLADAANHFDTYHIHIEDGFADVAAAKNHEEQFKARDMVELISDFAEFLPNMDVHASLHDMGPNIFGDDFRAEIEQLLNKRDYMTTKKLTTFESKARNQRHNVTKACFDDAPAVLLEQEGILSPPPPNDTFEFIYSHPKTFNFCQNPSILSQNGIFSVRHARDSHVLPLFVQCKLQQGGDIQYPSLVQWQDPPAPEKLIPWRERPNNKLFWRGRMTGAHYNKQYGWRHTHRFRLHELAWNETFAEEEVPVLVDGDAKTQKGLKRKSFKRKELNDALLDVGLVGDVFQCDEKDGTCDEIRRSVTTLEPIYGAGKLAKYALDVDGNGWSGRYQSLLAAGSVVLKATVFPEWISDWLVPYYHFVPIQHDYSDLYSTMVFFAGYPTTSSDGKTTLTGGHEDLAESIAQHALDAGRSLWRWEDMQAYMFRLLLEYARAMNVNRDAMAYKPKVTGEGR